VVELGNCSDEFGGRRHGAGRAGGDHRSVAARSEPYRFRLDQRIAARGRLDGPSFGEDFRPGFTRNLQKFQRELPVTVERFGYEPIQPLQGYAARDHVVHQAREVIGKRECRGRIIGDERRLAVLIGCNASRPFEHQPREQ
jgi:hypothetical protein